MSEAIKGSCILLGPEEVDEAVGGLFPHVHLPVSLCPRWPVVQAEHHVVAVHQRAVLLAREAPAVPHHSTCLPLVLLQCCGHNLLALPRVPARRGWLEQPFSREPSGSDEREPLQAREGVSRRLCANPDAATVNALTSLEWRCSPGGGSRQAHWAIAAMRTADLSYPSGGSSACVALPERSS
eukprot:CAMPEP_0182856898 /NCGR_PEP_ID=MMETSP0034_2-20130328/2726_1 /TAXON_ID=156128 /ORGANISM="Nephroselmis pyriformis, Strain CCMP717" /LENGTH=181 /DNA_ID=CAMNT_0024988063 /DNA_START=558 /DNA_END=1101 /DNA_ORIENTATION=-